MFSTISGVGSLVRSGVWSVLVSLDRPRFFFGEGGLYFGMEDLTLEYNSYYFFVLPPVIDAYDLFKSTFGVVFQSKAWVVVFHCETGLSYLKDVVMVVCYGFY